MQYKTLNKHNIMKHLVLFVIISFLFFSCNKEKTQKPEIAHYSFTIEDYKKIPPYPIGKKLHYKNQNNKTKTYTVEDYQFYNKLQHSKGWGFFTPAAAYFFYYDELFIEISDGYFQYPYTMHFQRWPTDVEMAEDRIYVEFDSELYTRLYNFPNWHGYDKTNIDANREQISLEINGKTYKPVYKVESDMSVEPANDSAIHTLYYFHGKGVIGFDDFQDNEWRLQME